MFSPKVPGEGQGPDQQNTYCLQSPLLMEACPWASVTSVGGVGQWRGAGAGTDWTSPV